MAFRLNGLVGSWQKRATGGLLQKGRVRAIGATLEAKHFGTLPLSGKNGGPSSIPKEHAGRAILPVHDGRQFLSPYDQGALVAA